MAYKRGSAEVVLFTDRINRLRNWQVAVIILFVSLAVFASGLTNPFLGDDSGQIVNNPVVHSIGNLKLFFEGSTFYNGGGSHAPLYGAYYRPLMTTTYSLLYTVFGAHSVYFHLLQLLLCVGSAFLLYLVFRYFLRPLLALFLALVFLIHPLDSQVGFAIASMQDALFFFFGILAIWLLLRFTSIKSLVAVAACLCLSLLAKETAVIFIIMSLLLLFWFDRRKRLYAFAAMLVPIVTTWLVLKTNAVGLLGANPNNAPIDRLDLVERLMTAPSILLFYITKFLFPWKLASGYYWTYPHFSIGHVLVPLMIDLLVIALAIYGAFVIRKRSTRTQYRTYIFFAMWAALGLLTTLQIIPLDMTVCETWAYFPMAGVLGMIGVLAAVLVPDIRINKRAIFVLLILLLTVLGGRTAGRGTDWRDAHTLFSHDILTSKEDYAAYNALGYSFMTQGQYDKAKPYVLRSINTYPYYSNYLNLGVILTYLGDYSGARQAYEQGLRYGNSQTVKDNLAALTLVNGDEAANERLIRRLLKESPHDAALWMYLALLDQKQGDNTSARAAIVQAASYGSVPPSIYRGILADRPFAINFAGKQVIKIP